jgi:hypothetical protein
MLVDIVMIDTVVLCGNSDDYQMGNQNPHIEEEQTKQWPKEKVQKDKQRSTL